MNAPRSLSDLRLIDCTGGKAVHFSPISRDMGPLHVSKSAKAVFAFPSNSRRLIESDRLPVNQTVLRFGE